MNMSKKAKISTLKTQVAMLYSELADAKKQISATEDRIKSNEYTLVICICLTSFLASLVTRATMM